MEKLNTKINGQSKKRILVIDDEELLTRTFSLLLEKNGYQVSIAKNGDEALALYVGNDFSLIICDIRMPGKDGVQTIRLIKNLRVPSKQVPVIFITGFADDQIEEEAKRLKPLGYLFKPFNVQELMGLVKSGVRLETNRTVG